MPDFSQLTERQRAIYDFIREKIDERGYGPTVREIGLNFDIKSPNGVMCHLKALQTKGFITRNKKEARAIQLTDYKPGGGLPLRGTVAAGSLLEAVEETERLDFKDLFDGPNHFALRVRGLSMIEDHIEDGDYVVIHEQETAAQGERVVVMVHGEATLKYYYQDANGIRLQPANSEMEPIYLDAADSEDAKILGVLVGVLRKC